MNTSSCWALPSGRVIRSLGARPMKRTVLLGLALILAFALGGGRAGETSKAGPVLSAESRTTYEQRVLPFLKKHCWKCHDESSAEAGFRVDDLGTDFLAGKTADRWREAIDQINLGKMPK